MAIKITITGGHDHGLVQVEGHGTKTWARCQFKRSNWCCGVSELGNFAGEGDSLRAVIREAIKHPEMRNGIWATTTTEVPPDTVKFLKELGFEVQKTYINSLTRHKITFWFRVK